MKDACHQALKFLTVQVVVLLSSPQRLIAAEHHHDLEEGTCTLDAGDSNSTGPASLLQKGYISGHVHLGEGVELQQLSAPTEEALSDAFHDVPMASIEYAARYGVNFTRPMAPLPNSESQKQSPFVFNQRDSSFEGQAGDYIDDDMVRSALTTVECALDDHNRTCAFKNLYFNHEGGGFQVLTLQGEKHPDFESVMLLHKWSSKGQINRKDFASIEEFRGFLETHRPQEHSGLSLVYDSIWHHNIGHALWDGLYPAFVALCQWGRHKETFRSVIGIAEGCLQKATEDGKCMSEGAFRKFGGGEFMPYATLSGSGWHKFTDAIAGSGRKGQRTINQDYTLPGGRELDAARLFRDRMYASHGLEHPAPCAASHEHGRQLRGIVIANKRFTENETVLLHNISEEEGPLALSYTDFAEQAHAGNFTRHLEIIGEACVHISSVGTAQCYAPFLSDGAVHVALGFRSPPMNAQNDKRFVSFLEEVWSEGVPYVRALHYDPYMKLPASLERGPLEELIQTAADLAEKGFAIPVQPGENLSPVARVFKEYCHDSASDCSNLLSLMNGDRSAGFGGVEDVWWCNANALAEHVVFEIGGWSEQGAFDNGKVIHCAINRDLMRRLRAQRLLSNSTL